MLVTIIYSFKINIGINFVNSDRKCHQKYVAVITLAPKIASKYAWIACDEVDTRKSIKSANIVERKIILERSFLNIGYSTEFAPT